MAQLNPILNTAFKAARKAGDMMIRAAGSLNAVKPDSSAFNDFIAEVERTADQIITQAIAESYPHHRISSITRTAAGKIPAHEWIIAPLDGITNYRHGSSQYAVSIAYLEKGSLKDALVYIPERNDLYTASRGQGALLNDRRIRVSDRIDLSRCLIGAGLPDSDQTPIAGHHTLVAEIALKTAGIRRQGAASIDLCHLAEGSTDGFFDSGLNPCAAAAGALIVQEAGGIITDPAGEQNWFDSGSLVAANPKILAQLLRIAAQHI